VLQGAREARRVAGDGDGVQKNLIAPFSAKADGTVHVAVTARNEYVVSFAAGALIKG